MGSNQIASNSSERIKDSDSNSFGRHGRETGLFKRQGFEGHSQPEVPKKPEVNRKIAILV